MPKINHFTLATLGLLLPCSAHASYHNTGLYLDMSASATQLVFEDMTVGYDDAAGRNQTYEVKHDVTVVPKLTLGYASEDGLGIELQASALHSKGELNQPENGGSLDSDFDIGEDDADITVTGTLYAEDKMHIIDGSIETYQRFGEKRASFTPRAGIRFVRMHHDTRLWETGRTEFIDAQHHIIGAGPKLGMGSHFALTKQLNAILGSSGSFILAREKMEVRGEDGSNDLSIKRNDLKILPILSINAGLEWTPKFTAEKFSIGAYVDSEYWIGGGGWDFSNDGGGSQFADTRSWGSIAGRVSAIYRF